MGNMMWFGGGVFGVVWGNSMDRIPCHMSTPGIEPEPRRGQDRDITSSRYAKTLAYVI